MKKLTKEQRAAVIEQVHNLLVSRDFSKYYSEPSGEFTEFITGDYKDTLAEAAKRSKAALTAMLDPLLGKIK